MIFVHVRTNHVIMNWIIEFLRTGIRFLGHGCPSPMMTEAMSDGNTVRARPLLAAYIVGATLRRDRVESEGVESSLDSFPESAQE